MTRGPLLFTLVVALGLVLVWLVIGPYLAPATPQAPEPVGATLAAAPTPRTPEVHFEPAPGARQAARRLEVSFSSSTELLAASVTLDPNPGIPCAAALLTPTSGRFGCEGLLGGARDFVATLAVTSAGGRHTIRYAFRTMGDRLEGVPWFTEFEDPAGDPLACASASVRILQLFTTGEDKLTAEAILRLGRQFNRSSDPGIDPVAIATVLQQLDSRNRYHYYVYPTREEATRAAAYWLLRSGKPVVAITLAGQHAPVVIGFSGRVGASYADPTTRIDGLVVLDPQRGDLNPLTAQRRPDKYRSADFQTGKLVDIAEWYGDEWWLGYAYATTIQYAGRTLDIERNDGAYPRPHWGGQFVIVADDGDAENPPDRVGRVSLP